MDHTRLGRTGLQVSKLCLGTMTFGLQCDEPTSVSILDRAAEGGIDFIDSSDVYPLGRRSHHRGPHGGDSRSMAARESGTVRPRHEMLWEDLHCHLSMAAFIEDTSLMPLKRPCVVCRPTTSISISCTGSMQSTDRRDAQCARRSGTSRQGGVTSGVRISSAYQLVRAVGRSETLRLTRVRLGATSVQPAVPSDRA